MPHQNKILRVLQLINCLQSNPPKTKQQLSTIIDAGTRTVYRYFELLEEIGFKIEKDSYKRYYIDNSKIIEPAAFTEQEINYLSSLLHTNSKNNPLSKSLLQKIAVRSDVHVASDLMNKAHISKIIEDIQYAITLKKQIILKKYQSINSQTISDRKVEPISIDNNYRTITAYEVASKKNKTFVVERIKRVEHTPIKFKHEKKHLETEKDAFGFSMRSDARTFPVHLELTLKAKILLTEEYPVTAKFINKRKNQEKYIFKCHINDPRPLERFIFGLPNDIKKLKGHEQTEIEYNLI